MVREILKIYTDNGLGAKNPTFHDIEITEYSNPRSRMGIPTLTATLMWDSPLDKEWTGREYVDLNGERWHLKKTASAEKNNGDTRYKHTLNFRSGWEILTQVYFYDVVREYSSSADRPSSNSADVKFYGTIREYVDRLNCAFLYAGIADSILKTKTTLTQADTPVGDGFCAILSEDGESDLSVNAEFSFTDQWIWDTLPDAYNKTGVPFSLRGKAIIFNEPSQVVNHVFRYGYDDALLSVAKNNANNKVVNRITFRGSSENIPHYYPNKSEYGDIKIKATEGNKVLSPDDIEIVRQNLFTGTVTSDKKVFVTSKQILRPTLVDNSLMYLHDNQWVECRFNRTYEHRGENIYGMFDVRYKFTIRVSKRGDFIVESIGARYWASAQPLNGENFIPVSNIIASEYFKIDKVEDNTGKNITGKASKENGKLLLTDLPVGENTVYFTFSWSESRYSYWRLTEINFASQSNPDYFLSIDGKEYKANRLGIELKRPFSADMVGDSFYWIGEGRIAFQTNLMPPLYSRGVVQGVRKTQPGNERFYNALNDTYKRPDGTYMAFPHVYMDGNPNEYIYVNENIKPTIEGVENANGDLFGVITDIAFDSDDNDSLKVDMSADGADKNDSKNYEHSFFYIKLNRFDGQYGFDLFKSASQTDPMTIQMTSGSCDGCKFKIQVLEKTDTGEEVWANPVQVQSPDGSIVPGTYTDKVSDKNIQPHQQNTKDNSIWICVQKDAETFGVIMPNRSNNFLPKVGDTFNIINIDLPQGYIDAAEDRGEREMLDALLDNNEEKFTFDITASRIFLAEHPEILAELDEYSMIDVEYNGIVYRQYVSQVTLDVKDSEALPDIRIDLVDEIAVGQGFIEEVAAKAADMIGTTAGIRSGIGAGGGITQATADGRYINKTKDDRTEHKISSDVGFEVGSFVAGSSGGALQMDNETGQSYIEVDKLRVRMKAIFEELEISEVKTLRGENMITPGGGMNITFVDPIELDSPVTLKRTRLGSDGQPQRDSSGNILYDNIVTRNVYRCYFKQADEDRGITSAFRVGDEAYCKEFNITDGTHHNATNQFYWRAVVAVADGYIDLSVEDCATDSGTPQAGDTICQYGSHNALDRQSAIVLSTVNAAAPSVTLYNGITAYNTVNKSVVEYGVDKSKNPPEPFFKCYGSFFFGPRDERTYLKFDAATGSLIFKGKLIASSTIDDKPIADYIKDETDKVNVELRDKVNELQNQIDGVIETWNEDTDPTKTNYPASDWNTDEERMKHAGDVYFNIGAYDPVNNPNAGHAWRWYYKSPTDYGWIEIADSDAVRALELAHMSVMDTDVLFIQTDSQTNTPTLPTVNASGVITDPKGWTTDAPQWVDGKYIWQTTYVRKGDGKSSFSDPTCISGRNGKDGPQGVPGETGADGKTYYTWIRYADDEHGNGISNNPTGKDYIGFAYNKETAIESNNPTDYTWSKIKGEQGAQGLRGLQGEQGEQGIPGQKGADGKTSYFHIKYSAVPNPTDASQMTETPSTYIGTYVDYTEADSSDPKKYTWSRFEGMQGADGSDGIPGTNGVDGKTSYLHIKYSNDGQTFTPAGGGLALGEQPGDWIGQYTDFNQKDSTNFSDYTWSKIKGEQGNQGVPGQKGADGKQYWTWIKYSDNANGTPMYDTPNTNTKYIGIAVNKETQTEGSNPSDYTWSLFRGDDGTSVAIDSQSVKYSTVHTSTQPADSTFTLTTVPTLSEGQFLWSMTTVTYNNGMSTKTYAVSKIGTSVKVKTTEVKYAKSTTSSQPADTAFTYNNIGDAGVKMGEYLWTRTTVTYTDNTSLKSYSVSRIGADGSDGIPGTPGADGRTPYVHYAYANSADGKTGFSTTYFANALYVGVCSDYNQADPTTYGSYEWARLKGDKGDKGEQGLRGLQGEKGEQGIAGAKGADGKTSYFHIKYAPVQNPTASQMTETPSTYIGTYVDYTAADSSDPSKYTWARFEGIQGADGSQGIPGKNGADGKTSYLHIKYSNDGKTFTPAQGNLAIGETPGDWIGQYTDFTQADSTDFSKYTWSKIKGDDGSNAKSVTVNGEQTFSYTNNFTSAATPTSITLSATLQNTTGYQWSYKRSNQSSFTNISGATAATLAVAANNTTYFPSGIHACTFRCTSGSVYDEMTLVKVSSGATGAKGDTGAKGNKGDTGANGADGYTVLLSNESHIFKGDTEKAVEASTSSEVIAYKGSTRVAATIGTATGLPTGMTITVANNGTTTAKFTAKVTTALTTKSGVVSIPVTVDGKSFTRTFSWTLSLDGIGITETAEYYAISNSSTTAPADSAFSTTVPTTTTAKPYLWNYEKTTYSNGVFKSTSKRVIGVHGQNGTDGAGISKVENYYLASASASGVTTSTSGWTTDAASTNATISDTKPYLWNYEKITYTKGNPTTTSPHIIGKYGKDGNGIDRIEEEYYLSTSRTALQGGSWSTTKPTWKAGHYYWTRTHIYYDNGDSEVTNGICVTGEMGTSVLAQYSANGTSWHSSYTSGDQWMRTSDDNGATWSAAVKITASNFTNNLLLQTENPHTRINSQKYYPIAPGSLLAVGIGKKVTISFDYEYSNVSTVAAGDTTSNKFKYRFGGGVALKKPDGTNDYSFGYWHTLPQGKTGLSGKGTFKKAMTIPSIASDSAKTMYLLAQVLGGTVKLSNFKMEYGENSDPVWNPNTSEMTGKWRKFQWAKVASATTPPTSGWQDTPLTAPAGEYVWMRSGMVVPPATKPTAWETAIRVTGDKGTDGQSVYSLDLSNEVSGIICNSSGAVTGTYPTCKATVWKGAGKVTTGVTYSIASKTGISTASIDSSGNVTMSGMTADKAEIVVQAVVNGVTLQATITLYKVKPGANGTAAVMYSIEPSVDNITRSMTGGLSISSVTCDVYKTTGNTARVKDSAKSLYYQRIPDITTWTKLTLTNGVSAAVGVLSTTEAVIFELRDGSTVLDRERVPVLSDAGDLEISSRNLLRKSREFTITASASNNYAFKVFALTIPLKRGDYIALTVEGITNRAGSPTEYTCGCWNANIDKSIVDSARTLTATKKTAVFKITTDENNPKFLIYAGKAGATSGNSVKFTKAILVKGNVPMETWSPAPEDFDYITEAIKGNTVVNGGLVLSSLIKLGSWTGSGNDATMSKVWAGMNGVYGNGKSIASWWGGDMVDKFYTDAGAARPTALTSGFAAGVVRMDGTGYLAKGNIKWDSDGSADFAGGKLHIDSNGNLTLGAGVAIGGNQTLAGVTNFIAGISNLLVAEDANGKVVSWSDANLTTKAVRIKAAKSFYSTGGVSALGNGNVSGSGGSGGTSYNRLDEWKDYTNDKAGYVLSAKLGYDLYSKLEDIVGADSDNVINKWNEVVAFLNTYTEADTLANLLGNKADKSQLSNYVTLSTAQTISGQKTFSSRLRIIGSTATPAWNSVGLTFAENVNDAQAVSLTYTSYDSYRAPAGIKLHGVQGNEWFEAPRFIKTGGTSAQLLAADGSVRTIKSRSSVGTLDWSATSDNIPNISLLAYWNGAYTNTASNLQYCDRGRFGTIVTAASDAYLSRSGGSMLNANLVTNLNADLLDGIHAANFAYVTNVINFLSGSAKANITTAKFIEKLTALEAFNRRQWSVKCSWSYANNDIITDSGLGNIQLAGATIETFCEGTNRMIRVTTSPTATDNGVANAVFIYRDHGSSYAPNWKRLANTTDNVASASKLQTARTLWGKSFDGTANVTGNLTSVGNITGSAAMTIKANGALTLHSTANIALKANNDDTKSVILTADAFKPYDAATTKLTLGRATARWATLYATGGNFTGEVFSTSANAFRAKYGSYGFFIRQDGANTYFMLTAKDDAGGTYNALRPFRINNESGNVYIGNSALCVAHGGNVGVGTTSPSYKLHVSGTLGVTGLITASASGIKIGDATISWDSVNKALKVDRSFYSTGGVSALGSGSASGSGGSSFGLMRAWGTSAPPSTTNDALGANLGYDLHTRVKSLEGGSALSVTTTGSGNAVTAIAKNGTAITVTKGATFLTSHQSLDHINSLGRLTAQSGTTKGTPGLRMYEVYNNGYPVTYGNLIKVQGGVSNGGGELLLGWMTTKTDTGRVLYRSQRDGTANSWTPWKTVAWTSDIPTSMAWTAITSKPTTLSGYGITDAYTKTQADSKDKVLPQTGETTGTTLADFNTDGTRVYQSTADKGDGISYQAILSVSAGSSHRYFQIIGGKGNTSLRWRNMNSNGTALADVRTLLDNINYSAILDGRYYTESEINTKLTNGSVTKVGTATVGSGTKPMYLNAGIPTASTATVGAANRPVYLNGGTITAGTYTFGNANGNAPISNGTVNTNLNADLLDGRHLGCAVGTIPWWQDLGNYSLIGVSNDDSQNYQNLLKRIVGSGTGDKLSGYALFGTFTPNTQRLIIGRAYNNNEIKNDYPRYSYFLSLALGGQIKTFGSNDGTYYEKSVAFTTDNVASASKLQTARTLWGKSFDGTANVTGNLTSVGNITGSAAMTIKANGALTLHSTANIALKANNDDTKSVILTADAFKPYDAATTKLTLGRATARWATLYATGGNFTAPLTINYTTETGINLYRREAGGGAFIRFYNANQTTNFYRIGMYGDGKYGIGYNGTDAITILTGGNVGIGQSAPTTKLDVNGAIHANGWIGTTGNVGWKSDTHGGGIYMADATWVRTYNGKAFYTAGGTIRSDGRLQCGANSEFSVDKDGNLSSTKLAVRTNTGIGDGISLYNGVNNIQSYGILFGKTATFGTHGGITGDWATYFTMDGGTNAAKRGWIFRHKTGGNVASISHTGDGRFFGKVFASFMQVGSGGGITQYPDDKTGSTYWYGLTFAADNYVHLNGYKGIKFRTASITAEITQSGGFVCSGGVTCLSDMRHKTVVSQLSLRLDDIAKAPSFRHVWNDRPDRGIHVGSSAQYWQRILPQVVEGGDSLSLDYGKAALLSVISVAKETLDLKGRVAALERENKELRRIISTRKL